MGEREILDLTIKVISPSSSFLILNIFDWEAVLRGRGRGGGWRGQESFHFTAPFIICKSDNFLKIFYEVLSFYASHMHLWVYRENSVILID